MLRVKYLPPTHLFPELTNQETGKICASCQQGALI